MRELQMQGQVILKMSHKEQLTWKSNQLQLNKHQLHKMYVQRQLIDKQLHKIYIQMQLLVHQLLVNLNQLP